MNGFILKKATKEQLSMWGKRSQEVQMIKRMMAEPPLYRPTNSLKGIVYACSFQLQIPVEHKIFLFDTGREDSFRSIIDDEKQNGRGGWYDYSEKLARMMPRRIIRE